jgi:hypothetical protein
MPRPRKAVPGGLDGAAPANLRPGARRAAPAPRRAALPNGDGGLVNFAPPAQIGPALSAGAASTIALPGGGPLGDDFSGDDSQSGTDPADLTDGSGAATFDSPGDSAFDGGDDSQTRQDGQDPASRSPIALISDIHSASVRGRMPMTLVPIDGVPVIAVDDNGIITGSPIVGGIAGIQLG